MMAVALVCHTCCTVLLLVLTSHLLGAQPPAQNPGLDESLNRDEKTNRNGESVTKSDVYEAIRMIHGHLDGDKSGSIDENESFEFLTDEMNITGGHVKSSFLSFKAGISVENLWKTWKNSEVCKWSPEMVAKWIADDVSLPMYSDSFLKYPVDGQILPRLANQNDIILADLGITNHLHRQKIFLKVAEVVVFGLKPAPWSIMKDLLVWFFVCMASIFCWLTYRDKLRAQSQIDHLTEAMTVLQKAEKELKKASTPKVSVVHNSCSLKIPTDSDDQIIKMRRPSPTPSWVSLNEGNKSDLEKVIHALEEELAEVQDKLSEAHRKSQLCQVKDLGALHQLLLQTFRMEFGKLYKQRQDALRVFQEAREMCMKVDRTRSDMLGSFRLMHNRTLDSTADLIHRAKMALDEVTVLLREHQQRWSKIEAASGFQITRECHLPAGLSFGLEPVASYRTLPHSRESSIEEDMSLSDENFVHDFIPVPPPPTECLPVLHHANTDSSLSSACLSASLETRSAHGGRNESDPSSVKQRKRSNIEGPYDNGILERSISDPPRRCISLANISQVSSQSRIFSHNSLDMPDEDLRKNKKLNLMRNLLKKISVKKDK